MYTLRFFSSGGLA